GELLELEAQGFSHPSHALFDGLADSEESYSVLYRGAVVAMFGVSVQRVGTLIGGGDVGMLWFLTGHGFELAAWHALPLARSVVAALLERYGVLVASIDARYAGAVRLARHLGFDVQRPQPFGVAGLPFHLAVLER